VGHGGGRAHVRCGVGADNPAGESGGCGVASAADVAPVARLARVMQFLARAEPMLGCDRKLVVPLATEAGQLDALNARLPPALEPLYQVGLGPASLNCQTGMSEASTGGRPG